MPRSRSRSMLSSSWARIARGSTVCVSSRIRSASVDLPWSMWAMIEKLRMCAWSATRRTLGGAAESACEQIDDLACLGDPHGEHQCRVHGAPERDRAADRDQLREQRAPERLVEGVPDAVRDDAEDRA